MKSAKLLFILPDFQFGGTVMSTYNMLSIMQDHNFDFDVISFSDNGPWRNLYDRFQVIPTPLLLSLINGAPLSKRFYKVLYVVCRILKRLTSRLGRFSFENIVYKYEAEYLEKEYKYDTIVACVETSPTRFASYFNNCTKIAWFRSEYSKYKNLLSSYRVKEEQFVYSKFDKIVCVSKITKDDFAKHFPNIGSDRLFAIHNIQDVDSIILKSKENVDDQFDKEFFNIVSVGRIAPQKRFDVIPSMARKLHERGLMFKWYIIGDGNLWGAKERFELEYQKNNCSEYVICLGGRKNPYPYIAAADLLVNTSEFEACPRVVAEAKILHTPVVCADFSSASEFVESNYDGYVGPVDQIWLNIKRFIDDKQYYNEIKNNCNQYVMDNELILEQLKSLFSYN